MVHSEGAFMNSPHLGVPCETDFVITRTLAAPRELVFQAWTDCHLFARWWGPKGFRVSSCTVDARPGGLLHYVLRGVDGRVLKGRGIFRDVFPPERIVLLDALASEHGEVAEPWAYGMSADWPAETRIELTLSPSDGSTVVTLCSDVFAPPDEAEALREGWEESLDKLAELLGELMRSPRESAAG
jgi:uncharacterized protein YndB with AHSA1/START domain